MILCLLAPACTFQFHNPAGTPIPSISNQLLKVSNPPSPSLTPFQPLPPTATSKPIPTDPSPVPSADPTSSETPTPSLPAPASTPPEITLWVDPALPEALRTGLALPAEIAILEQEE
jgi:hypothetical protein